MLSRTPSRFLLAILVVLAGWTSTGRASIQDRIAGAIASESRVTLAHTVSPRTLEATDLGAAPASQKLEGMTMRFSMTDAQKAALDKLLRDQQDPNSPRYRQWLTPQQFGAQFGLSASDLAKVSSWLTSQGLTVTGVAKSSTFITFSGTVGQVQQAFGTSIHRLSLDGENHTANVTDPVLPAAMADVVSSISGLNTFRLKPRLQVRRMPAGSVRPDNTINTTNGVEHFLAPGDFYTIYDMNSLLTSSINGTGITIAVMGQVDPNLADVAAFRTASGLSANVPSIQVYGVDPGSPSAACLGSNPPNNCSPSVDDLDETELDLEWAGATAPSAKILFVNSTDVLGTSLVQAIDNNLAPIMTVSYGGCETQDFSASAITAFTAAFQEANAKGITVVGPSGDSGATDCDDTGVQSATHGLAVDFPGSSPYVTSVGGTEFSEGSDTAGAYWNTSNGAFSGSAKSYIPETVWNDTAAEIVATPPGPLSAGGGGASILFTKPVWQVGTGVPNDAHRDVPDVSFSASAQHDPYLVCAEGSCQGGTYFVQSGTNAGSFNAFGGTSVSTPSFAGILALVEQKLGATRIGNINPYIYALANGTSATTVFHDVTTGNNNSPCTTGSIGCASGGNIGYSAGVGYDQATGWGSVDVYNFANQFSSVTLQQTTTTAVTFTPTNPVIGQSVIFTATVTQGSGSTIPTGTVAFSVNGGAPTAVTVSSTGTATYSTSFNTGGAQTVSAVYSGDKTYYGSTGTANVAVTIVGGAATTTILSANPTSVALSSSLTLTATVSSTISGTLAGTVTYYAGSTSLGTAALTAAAAGNSGTTTLTLTVAAATLPVGSDSLTAVFGGGGTAAGSTSYMGSTSAPISITVTNPSLSVSAGNISIADGATGTTTVTLTSGGGYSGNVTLSATATSTALLNNASVTFNPATIALTSSTPGTSTFTISTPAAVGAQLKGGTHMKNSNGFSMLLAGGGISFAGLLLFGISGLKGRRMPLTLLSLFALAALGAVMGCGSSSNSVTYPVPKGSYQVTIVGTDTTNSSITGSTTITLTLN